MGEYWSCSCSKPLPAAKAVDTAYYYIILDYCADLKKSSSVTQPEMGVTHYMNSPDSSYKLEGIMQE